MQILKRSHPLQRKHSQPVTSQLDTDWTGGINPGGPCTGSEGGHGGEWGRAHSVRTSQIYAKILDRPLGGQRRALWGAAGVRTPGARQRGLAEAPGGRSRGFSQQEDRSWGRCSAPICWHGHPVGPGRSSPSSCQTGRRECCCQQRPE